MPISGLIMVGYGIRNVLREILSFWKLKHRDEGQPPQNI